MLVQCDSSNMNVTAGDRIGPYEIKALLGEGGMGVVFQARDTALQRDVALKLLPEKFANDGERFARCFTEDATYHDYIYGPHTGRKDIAHMLTGLFRRDAADDYRWEFFDPVVNGTTGYAWSLSSFTSLVPQFKGQFVVIDGISRFTLRDGLIAEYRESVNGGVARSQ